MQPDSQTAAVCRHIVHASGRSFPEDILDEARKCLMDWLGVCMGAYDAPEARKVAAVADRWNTRGNARYLWGGSAAAPAAALVNGTLSHCLDYDDTHIPSVIHVSAPLWAGVLARAAETGASEELVLKAFVTGFEVAARVGDNGIGIRLNNGGWHSTPTLGPLGVAAAAAVLMGLDEQQTAHALGLAATQASGLTASFGTMAKPLHVGKAAMAGLLAADLAAEGVEGAAGVLDRGSPLVRTLLQDGAAELAMAPFEAGWEIRRNSFKPYAACQLTHSVIDAGRAAAPAVGSRAIESIRVVVHPLAIKIAGVRDARTATEGKFSLGYCTALGLKGYPVTTQDFTAERLADPALVDIARRVEYVADDGLTRTAARLEIRLADGSSVVQVVEHAFGSIGNPMGWAELEAKFMALATPVAGADADALLACLRGFGKPGSMDQLFMLSRRREGGRR